MRTIPWETRKEDIGWLAGIVDGEGSLYAALKDEYPHFRYSFVIVNTNLEMLEKFQSIVRKICGNNGQFTVSEKKTGIGILAKKKCYVLYVRRIDDLKGMLTAILPHLTEKRAKAQYLLDTLNSHKRYAWYKKEASARNEQAISSPKGDEAVL